LNENSISTIHSVHLAEIINNKQQQQQQQQQQLDSLYTVSQVQKIKVLSK